MKKLACLFFICFIYISTVNAETPSAAIKLEASIKSLYFNYEEFDLSGDTFNEENGSIPGISLTIFKTANNFTNSFSFESYGGRVDYDGMTQSGAPLKSKTDETLYRLFYRVDWSPEEFDNTLYGKILWQRWDRNILPTTISSSLFEQYQWWVLELGFTLPVYRYQTSFWLFEFGILKTTHGTIEIDLSRQTFGKPELSLGSGSGLNTSLIYQYTINTRNQIGFSLQYQHWEFSRSNTQSISNGIITFDITEPESESDHTTLSINYQYHF